jgi:hypothetical protein
MAITHSESLGQSYALHIVDADPSAGAGQAATTGDLAIYPGFGLFCKVGAGDTNWSRLSGMDEISDPGDAAAIPVTQSGFCMLTSAGAETRTLAIPSFAGQTIDLCCDTYVGNVAITVASAFDVTGNTTITMGNAGDSIKLVGATIGGTLAWRILANNGCALT